MITPIHHFLFLPPFLLFIHLTCTYSLSPAKPVMCHDEERSNLLEFKKTFAITPEDPSSYDGLRSWNLKNNDGNCCNWEGIQCDQVSGHVKNLTIKGCLQGSIESASTLFRLQHLQTLDLSWNNFNLSRIPHSIVNLSSLSHLVIHNSNLSGQVPSFLSNLTKLSALNLSYNEFTGQPFSSLSWTAQMSNLVCLKLARANLVGEFPSFTTNMSLLQYLDISSNNLHGTVDIGIFKNSRSLYLSYNNLSVLPEILSNTTLSRFQRLGLGSCNLSKFPTFLGNLSKLEYLDLGSNKISGKVPKWMMNVGTESLQILYLDNNTLTGFESREVTLPWTQIKVIDFGYNMLEGSLPIPPPSATLYFYIVKNNTLSGPIPQLMCNLNLSQLLFLDLSFNNLSGKIPPCLDNKMNSIGGLYLQNNGFVGPIPKLGNDTCELVMIDLRFNQFLGTIPESLVNCKNLTYLGLANNQIADHIPSWLGSLPYLWAIDLNHNQLRGQIPRTLAKCSKLEFLNLGNNQLKDSFPSWLGNLQNLRVLSLRSNRLHGKIRINKVAYQFNKLRILDISSNNFKGEMPSLLFKHLHTMEFHEEDREVYMSPRLTMKINNKGHLREYIKIPNALVSIDFSCNNFIGKIPQVLGNLEALKILNLSNNKLNGGIPSSFVKLSVIESLDLSRNNLSGEIPQELTLLDALSFLNLSQNKLEGPIPSARHFDTFSNTSYLGNEGLCGAPLSKKCVTEAPSSSKQDPIMSVELEWKIILMGYGSGLVIGVSIGYMFTTWKEEWFLKFCGKKPPHYKRRQRMRRRTH